MGGWLNTSCIVVSIRAIASVRYREVVRSWEGPLWEVPLYNICTRLNVADKIVRMRVVQKSRWGYAIKVTVQWTM